MFKKSVLVMAASAAFIGMSGICSAASFTGWDKAIMPPSTNQHVDYRYPYIRVGAGAYDFNSSKIEVGTNRSTTAPLVKMGNSKITPFYNLAVGYAFYNAGTNWFTNFITKIFGHDNAAELQFDYFNLTQKRNLSSLGTGFLWFIDGSGCVLQPGVNPEPINSINLTAKRKYINGGLYYKGSWITSNPRVVFMPRAGLVATNLNEKYDYTVRYSTGAVPPSVRTDQETYKVNTNYYGVAAAGKLGYKVKPRFLVFGDLEAQLLYARSKLNAYQNGFVEWPIGSFVKNVSDKQSKVTYRAILAVGAQYKINNKITSPSIEAKIGVDRWGYDPRVIPPNYANDRQVHLASDQKVNYFANIGVTIPIG